MMASTASPASARRPTSRRAPIAIAIILFLILGELLLLFAGTGRVPNTLSLPVYDQWPLLLTLWGSNPAAALSVTAQQAIILIEHRASDVAVQVWGIYYFPITLAAYAVIAWFGSILYNRTHASSPHKSAALVCGASLLALSATYIRLASCCTVNPRWSVDLMLLAQALDTTGAWLDWQAVYRLIEPLLPSTQVLMAIGGATLLYWSARRRVA